MTHGPEPGRAPGGHEEFDLVAAIEADAEGIAFEDAVHLREGGGRDRHRRRIHRFFLWRSST